MILNATVNVPFIALAHLKKFDLLNIKQIMVGCGYVQYRLHSALLFQD